MEPCENEADEQKEKQSGLETSKKNEDGGEGSKANTQDEAKEKPGRISPCFKTGENGPRFTAHMPRYLSFEHSNTLSDYIEKRRSSSIAVLRKKAKEHEECLLNPQTTQMWSASQTGLAWYKGKARVNCRLPAHDLYVENKLNFTCAHKRIGWLLSGKLISDLFRNFSIWSYFMKSVASPSSDTKTWRGNEKRNALALR